MAFPGRIVAPAYRPGSDVSGGRYESLESDELQGNDPHLLEPLVDSGESVLSSIAG
jgi:hypothetical protein